MDASPLNTNHRFKMKDCLEWNNIWYVFSLDLTAGFLPFMGAEAVIVKHSVLLKSIGISHVHQCYELVAQGAPVQDSHYSDLFDQVDAALGEEAQTFYDWVYAAFPEVGTAEYNEYLDWSDAISDYVHSFPSDGEATRLSGTSSNLPASLADTIQRRNEIEGRLQDLQRHPELLSVADKEVLSLQDKILDLEVSHPRLLHSIDVVCDLISLGVSNFFTRGMRELILTEHSQNDLGAFFPALNAG